MTDHDPRTETGIPTEPVGSLPRPSSLQRAYGQYDAGEITRDQLDAEQDKAVADSIEHLEATGEPIISDGEQRWSSFATYAITDPLDEEIPGYSQEQFEADLVGECEKDIRQAFAAGAARVSVDFTEGRLATRNDHRNPWTGRNMLPHFIDLNNRVL